MTATYFITGTDTGVGKTLAALSLLRAAKTAGLKTVGLKPVAAGGRLEHGQTRNEDAELLRAAATLSLDYAQVNPAALPEAIAPHIAATNAGVELQAAELAARCAEATPAGADVIVIEGAGGWLVPLNDDETMADLCTRLRAPVVMVVGMRLGCLNHALLTAAAIDHAGLSLAGWIANAIDPDMAELAANVASLRARIAAPCLGIVPFSESGDTLDAFISATNFSALLPAAGSPDND